MVEQVHYIDKQTFLLDFDKEKTALGWQKTIFPEIRDELRIIMNDVFDRLIPEEQWLTIERIELDLGAVTSRDFTEKFRYALFKEMSDIVTKRKTSSSSYLNLDREERRVNGQAGQNMSISRTRNEVLLQTMLYFLEHGVLSS